MVGKWLTSVSTFRLPQHCAVWEFEQAGSRSRRPGRISASGQATALRQPKVPRSPHALWNSLGSLVNDSQH